MLIFWGMKKLWVLFGVITKLDCLWGSFLNILGLFHKVKGQNGLLKFQINFWVYLIFLILFWGKTVNAGSKPMDQE